jgi:hypothetical protein
LIPLIIGFALKFGALGGAMAWLVLQVLYAVLGTWLTHRRLLKGVGRTWLFQDVGVPLGLSILVGFSGYYATNAAEYSLYVKLILGAGLAIIASVPTLWLSPQLRSVAWNSIGWKKYSIKV